MNAYFKKISIFAVLFCQLSLLQCEEQNEINLIVVEKKVAIQGKEASIYAIEQPDGIGGYYAKKGEMFNVKLENRLKEPTSIHWHGLLLPNSQDGVAFITQYPIYPGLSYRYHFPIVQAGTFWMHSHVGFQEQRLLAAPLILYDPHDSIKADREVVLMLSDFSFETPEKIYQSLKCRKMSKDKSSHSEDIVEVNYDAFLTNYRTLESPEVIEVKPGEKVRLRFINGSSATNFFLFLGKLMGEAIAVDGNRIYPLVDSRFELAVAQRIDIILGVPLEGGVFPVLAQGEGTDMQTGLILATEGNKHPELSSKAVVKVGRLTNEQEAKLKALTPLSPKKVDRRITIELGGEMENYIWTLNGKSWPEVDPSIVEKGERVEIVFKNSTSMSHPMHLHGHIFQIVDINGKKVDGAMRDTILVTPNSTLSIQFDADNPGVWPLHCHLLYHLEAGMLTVLRYRDFIQPLL